MDEDDVFEDDEAVAAPRPKAQRSKAACPKCGSADIRRSNYESVWVTLNQTLGRWPFRCRNCRNLFFRPSPPPPED